MLVVSAMQEVVSLLHTFLQRPDVLAILETAPPPPTPSPSSSRGKERTFSFPMPKVVSQFLKVGGLESEGRCDQVNVAQGRVM